MIETNDILEINKRKFFISKFVPALEEWKKQNRDKGGTQKAFATMIGLESEDMIKKYKDGDSYPRPKTLKAIIKVLGVPDDYFTMKTEKDFYTYSTEYVTDIGENKILPYCEDIGLDPQFLVTVSNMFGKEFGNRFPFWTPLNISYDPSKAYKRPDPVKFWSNSAEMEPDVKMFQVKVRQKNGKSKRLILSFPDLDFLRDVQDEVSRYVEFLFWKRKEELKQEAEEASRRSTIKLDGGGIAHRLLPAAERNEIDRYFKNYVDNKPSDQTKDTTTETEGGK